MEKIDVQCDIVAESQITVSCEEAYFQLTREYRIGKDNHRLHRPINRYYAIQCNGTKTGGVYQTRKLGILFNKFTYANLFFNQVEYSLYPIYFEEEGAKYLIFCGEEQIALIKKSAVVVGDLHDFKLIVKDEAALQIAVLFTSYIYMTVFFRPGERLNPTAVDKTVLFSSAYKGSITTNDAVVKTLLKTTSKELLDMYDESFEQKY